MSSITIQTSRRALLKPKDGHFENTYYSDFISNLDKIRYAGNDMLGICPHQKTPTNDHRGHHYRVVALWIGNEFVNLPHNFRPHDWANYCVTWSSHTSGAELWINGMVGEQRYLRSGYTVSPGGAFILGKDQDGPLGISNSDAFVGKMTDVNVWDYVLTTADIRDQMSCESNSTVVGNVFSWGSTKLGLYGGVQLDSQYRCS